MELDRSVKEAITSFLGGQNVSVALFELFASRLEKIPGAATMRSKFSEIEYIDVACAKVSEEKRVEIEAWRAQDENKRKKSNPSLTYARPAIKRLRESLEEFLTSTAAKRLPFKVTVTGPPYGLQVEPQSPNVRWFWSRYFEHEDQSGQVRAPRRPVSIVYTEHLFYFHIESRYGVRHLDANDEKKDIRDFLPFIPVEHGELKPVRAFVNAREMRAVVRMTSCFADLAIPSQQNDSESALRSAFQLKGEGQDYVIFGNPRSSPLAAWMQGDLGLQFKMDEKDAIIEPGRDEPHRTQIGSSPVVFGTISSCYSQALSGHVTMALSVDGRFIAAAANLICNERSIANFAKQCGFAFESVRPYFEAIVKLSSPYDNDSRMEGYTMEVVKSRIIEPDSEGCTDR